jgi:hypothetical protein
VISLQLALSWWGWVVNNAEVKGSGCLVKFLGVVWLDKTGVIPNIIIDKIQVFPIPQDKVQLQAFVRLLGYWQAFISHMALTVAPCMP